MKGLRPNELSPHNIFYLEKKLEHLQKVPNFRSMNEPWSIPTRPEFEKKTFWRLVRKFLNTFTSRWVWSNFRQKRGDQEWNWRLLLLEVFQDGVDDFGVLPGGEPRVFLRLGTGANHLSGTKDERSGPGNYKFSQYFKERGFKARPAVEMILKESKIILRSSRWIEIIWMLDFPLILGICSKSARMDLG